MKSKIWIPESNNVISSNEYICQKQGNPFAVLDAGKIESAIHTAFYPGKYPFRVGGVPKIAAALCFYLIKAHAFMDGNKRTATIVSVNFLNINGWDLKYPKKKNVGFNVLANIIDESASGIMSKEQLIDWFDLHKCGL